MPRGQKSPVATILGLGATRPDATDLKNRFAERDQREALDDRTEAQKWLNDPPLWRSALTGNNDVARVDRRRRK